MRSKLVRMAGSWTLILNLNTGHFFGCFCILALELTIFLGLEKKERNTREFTTMERLLKKMSGGFPILI